MLIIKIIYECCIAIYLAAGGLLMGFGLNTDLILGTNVFSAGVFFTLFALFSKAMFEDIIYKKE